MRNFFSFTAAFFLFNVLKVAASGSGKHPQYAFAHRVNNHNYIKSALDGGITGIECDIIYSSSRGSWVVQHDTPNLSHAGPLLSTWLFTLKNLLATGRYDATFSALWLDIKSPNDANLFHVMQQVHSVFPSGDFAVIYDLNSKDNVLDSKRGYNSIKSELRDNEGIGVWLKSGEGQSVPDLIAKLRQDNITRATVSHGHAINIDEDTLKTINLLNNPSDPFCFKKVFTWTNALQSSMEDHINPSHAHRTDGQIIGSPIAEWLPRYADDDIPDFKDAVQEHHASQRMARPSDPFWTLSKQPMSYQVIIRTSDRSNAGTDSDIFLTIYGENGNTDEVRLNGYISGNAFERGDVDVVNIFAVDVGTITKIKIRSDGTGVGSDWYLDSISIGDNHAKFDRWIKEGSYTVNVTGPPKDYRIEVQTGDMSGAGTDSNIYVTIYGDKAATNEVRLNGYISGNAFERGDLDRLTLVGLVDVGTMKKLKVRSDGAWAGSGWYLSWVKVNGIQATFNRWIDGETAYASFPAPEPPTTSCMSGETGVLLRKELTRKGLRHDTSDDRTQVIKVKDLKEGDIIYGIDESKQPASCVVEAVGGFGRGPVYGNYTDGHYVLDADTGIVKMHGQNGVQTVQNKYIVLTSCPLGIDEAGIGFTPFDSDFFGEMTKQLSWKDYLLLYTAIIRVVKETGGFWFHGSSYDNLPFLHEHASVMCETILQCMKDHDNCKDFEDASMVFIERTLTESKKMKAYEALHNIGRHRELGSAAAAISAGGSVRK